MGSDPQGPERQRDNRKSFDKKFCESAFFLCCRVEDLNGSKVDSQFRAISWKSNVRQDVLDSTVLDLVQT